MDLIYDINNIILSIRLDLPEVLCLHIASYAIDFPGVFLIARTFTSPLYKSVRQLHNLITIRSDELYCVGAVVYKNACMYGNLDAIIWLYETFGKQLLQHHIDNLFNIICEKGHVHIAKWIYQNTSYRYPIGQFQFCDTALSIALDSDRTSMVLWLIHKLALTRTEVIEFIMEIPNRHRGFRFHIATLKKLHEVYTFNREDFIKCNMLYRLCADNNIEMVKWLYEDFGLTLSTMQCHKLINNLGKIDIYGPFTGSTFFRCETIQDYSEHNKNLGMIIWIRITHQQRLFG